MLYIVYLDHTGKQINGYNVYLEIKTRATCDQ